MSVERYRALLARQEREAQTLRHMSATRRTVTQQLLYRQHEAEWAQEIETRHSDQLGAALDGFAGGHGESPCAPLFRSCA